MKNSVKSREMIIVVENNIRPRILRALEWAVEIWRDQKREGESRTLK